MRTTWKCDSVPEAERLGADQADMLFRGILAGHLAGPDGKVTRTPPKTPPVDRWFSKGPNTLPLPLYRAACKGAEARWAVLRSQWVRLVWLKRVAAYGPWAIGVLAFLTALAALLVRRLP